MGVLSRLGLGGVSYRGVNGRNILIVTQNFQYGGLETQIRGQIIELKKSGWQVHMAVGDNFSGKYVPRITDSVTSGIDFNNNHRVRDLIRSVDQLSSIIIKNRISHIHAHPFTSLLPSYIAASINNIPLIVTLHGPASVLAGLGENYTTFLRHILLNSNVVTVSHETADIAKKIHRKIKPTVIPNAVSVSDRATPASRSLDPLHGKWLVASRLDSEKVVGIKHFITTATDAGVERIDVAGDGPAAAELQNWLLSRNLKSRVLMKGLVANVPKALEGYDACAGMGRVVLEALEKRRITALIGYDGLKGLIDSPDALSRIAYNNFSGRSLQNIGPAEFISECEEISPEAVDQVYEVIRKTYSQQLIWGKFIDYATQVRTYPSDNINKLYSRIIDCADLANQRVYGSAKVGAIAAEILTNDRKI